MTGVDTVYSLVPLVQTPRINPGDDIDIDLYIIGKGDVNWAQLFIIHSHPNLLADSFGSIESSIAPLTEAEYDTINEPVTGESAAESEYQTEFDPIGRGCHFPIPSIFFEAATDSIEYNQTLPVSPSYVEIPHDEDAPFHYSLETNSSASPGTYNLEMVLSYETANGDCYQDCHTIYINVRNFSDRVSSYTSIARIAGALIALASLMITAAAAASTAGYI